MNIRSLRMNNKGYLSRRPADYTFISNLINNRIDCSFLLGQINFYTPERRLRDFRLKESNQPHYD